MESTPTVNNPTQSWSPPCLGSIKINVDAAVGIQSTAIGIIATNHEGNVLAVQVFRGPFLFAEETEATAIQKACELAVRIGWKRIELETDCQNLAAEWNGNTGAISWQARIYIEQIRSSLCLFFDSFDLRWIP